MFLKHYRQVRFRVPDPLHPGQMAFDVRLEGSGMETISHGGEEYSADADGWFDLPDHVAAHLAGFTGWLSPEQVDEDRRVGLIRAEESTRPSGDAEVAKLKKEHEAEIARLKKELAEAKNAGDSKDDDEAKSGRGRGRGKKEKSEE